MLSLVLETIAYLCERPLKFSMMFFCSYLEYKILLGMWLLNIIYSYGWLCNKVQVIRVVT